MGQGLACTPNDICRFILTIHPDSPLQCRFSAASSGMIVKFTLQGVLTLRRADAQAFKHFELVATICLDGPFKSPLDDQDKLGAM